jgi:hypothetical protein
LYAEAGRVSEEFGGFMSVRLRTHVTFQSAAFNMTEPKDYFINPDNYGDGLARWLMRELRSRDVEVGDDPGQEDHGWYFTFRSGGVAHDFIVGLRDEGEWLGWLERSAGFVASLLGARKKGIEASAAMEIDAVLSGSERIQDVRWHFEEDFVAGREELGRTKPDAG